MPLDNGMDEVFAEAAAAVAEDVDSSAPVHDDSNDFDVPSYLDTLDDDGSESGSQSQSASAAQAALDRIKYTADGEEYEASVEEAVKALSLAKGARRAFSDRAKLKREVEKHRTEAQQNAEFRKQWEAVMKDAKSPSEVWERLTGNKFDSYLDQEMQRRRLYADASPEERKILDYEQKFNELNQRMSASEAEVKKRSDDAEQKLMQAGVDQIKGVLVPELERYADQLKSSNPQTANRLATMIYRNTIADLKEFKAQGYSDEQLRSPAVLRKVLARNAQAIIREDAQKVEKAVQKEVEKKKTVAKEQAQVAATKNYPKSGQDAAELSKLDPLALFQKLRR